MNTRIGTAEIALWLAVTISSKAHFSKTTIAAKIFVVLAGKAFIFEFFSYNTLPVLLSIKIAELAETFTLFVANMVFFGIKTIRTININIIKIFIFFKLSTPLFKAII